MKLLILGIVAAGKTTLARELSRTLFIPWYEGDCIVYREECSDRYKRSPEEQAEEIRRIDAQGDWIIEGTPRKSQAMLLELADRIVFLDPPLRVRKRRILTRWLRQKFGREKCHYQPTLAILKAMFRWTREFEDDRTDFLSQLARYGEKVRIIRTKKEIREWMRSDRCMRM